MKILITGATGMLGFDLCKVLSSRHSVVGIGRKIQKKDSMHRELELVNADITDADGLLSLARRCSPDIIIHAAAISDVDYCEVNADIASKVNAQGTRNVSDIAQGIGAQLIYISTDYVFDGKKDSPYKEDDLTSPVNIYGRSKLEGEEYIQARLKEYFIIRSSWMFGVARKNFIDHTLEFANKNKKVLAISDKYACLTYTLDLAKAISDLLDKNASAPVSSGIYHVTNTGACSRYELAKEILEYAQLEADVLPIGSKDAGGKAIRPKMSALDNSKISKLLGSSLRPYSQAVREYLANMPASAQSKA